MKTISVWGWETNEFYDPTRANNGGGYAQPAGGALFALPDGREVLIEVEDSSCGDFGSRVRYSVTLYQEGAPTHAWAWCEGTMGDAAIDDPQEVDDIIDHIQRIADVDVDAALHTASVAADICADYSPLRVG